MTRTPARTPAVAIGRALRALGLAQGQGRDFAVRGLYQRTARGRERTATVVRTSTCRAERVIARNADAIEAAVLADGGWRLTVSVRFADDGRPVTRVATGAADRVRESPPMGVDLSIPEEDEVPRVEAPEPEPVKTEPAPDPELDQHDRLPSFITVSRHIKDGRRMSETAVRCERCRAQGHGLDDMGLITLKWGPDAAYAADRAAWDHADDHRRRRTAAYDGAERERLEKQAGALQWSTRQANTMYMADHGELHHDGSGFYQMRDHWTGRLGREGRTVAAGRVQALLAAGLLATRGGKVIPTRDGKRALKAWGTIRPEPLAKHHRAEADPARTPYLLDGDEHRYRYQAAQQALHAARRHRLTPAQAASERAKSRVAANLTASSEG
ncbi:hypothetical protein ACIG3E_32930 [Streptomyces sp. NPDC053474]|uniref:hypothetical protein n=1 Tax=Streptomyces sp. NPDC053474 TaxID=3365704 RepID=UPI0037D21D12